MRGIRHTLRYLPRFLPQVAVPGKTGNCEARLHEIGISHLLHYAEIVVGKAGIRGQKRSVSLLESLNDTNPDLHQCSEPIRGFQAR